MSIIKEKEDLSEMVKSMGFKRVKSRYGERFPYLVKLFNDVEIEFIDDGDIRKLFQSYADTTGSDFMKSKKLVLEEKFDDEGNVEKEYICIKYVLNDGSEYRLFPKYFNNGVVIQNYYQFFKKTIKVDKTKTKE